MDGGRDGWREGGREGWMEGGRQGGREKSKGRRDGWSVDDICDCV